MSSHHSTRHTFRERRRTLTESEQKQAAKKVLEQVQTAKLILPNMRIACYLANDGELNPMPLIEYAWQQKASVYLPVIESKQAGKMSFVLYLPETQMKANAFGIPEPLYQSGDLVDACDMNLIFTPLVAFDRSGNRMGMGGGFYDRALASIHHQKLPVDVIGLAHQCQETSHLSQQSWDIPMQKIITDKEIIRIF